MFPGAIEAGLLDYIHTWLSQKPFERRLGPLFHAGTIHLDRIAKASHRKPFAACKPDQKDAILSRFQKGEIKAKRFSSHVFFQQLMLLILEGYLGDPKYGGNRNQVGWKFMGRKECWWQPRHLELITGTHKGLAY
jgi:gluconate 2-dehydrogenase gamma chain